MAKDSRNSASFRFLWLHFHANYALVGLLGLLVALLVIASNPNPFQEPQPIFALSYEWNNNCSNNICSVNLTSENSGTSPSQMFRVPRDWATLGLPLIYLALFVLNAAIISRRDRELHVIISEYALAHRQSRSKSFSTGPYFSGSWAVALLVVNFLVLSVGVVQLYLISAVRYDSINWVVPAAVWGCVALEGAFGVIAEMIRVTKFRSSEKAKTRFLSFVLERNDICLTTPVIGLDDPNSYREGWDYFHIKDQDDVVARVCWKHCIEELFAFFDTHYDRTYSKGKIDKLKVIFTVLDQNESYSEVQRQDLLRKVAAVVFKWLCSSGDYDSKDSTHQHVCKIIGEASNASGVSVVLETSSKMGGFQINAKQNPGTPVTLATLLPASTAATVSTGTSKSAPNLNSNGPLVTRPTPSKTPRLGHSESKSQIETASISSIPTSDPSKPKKEGGKVRDASGSSKRSKTSKEKGSDVVIPIPGDEETINQMRSTQSERHKKGTSSKK